jgi:hypothetical protein
VSYFGTLTRKNYESLEDLRSSEKKERMRRNVPPSGEDLREYIEEGLRSNQEREAAAQTQVDIELFQRLHPEFDDSPENNSNGFLLADYWRSRGVKWPTLAQFEEAFNHYKAQGVLKLKQDVLQKQHKADIAQRAQEIEEYRPPTEEEMYEMPMDELRQRAALGDVVRPRGPVSVSANFGR